MTVGKFVILKSHSRPNQGQIFFVGLYGTCYRRVSEKKYEIYPSYPYINKNVIYY